MAFANSLSGSRPGTRPELLNLNCTRDRSIKLKFSLIESSNCSIRWIHLRFTKKGFDHDAEEFIIGWAQEFPRRDPISLGVHVNQLPARGDAQHLVESAVHNYFAYRAKLNRLEFRIRDRWQGKGFGSELLKLLVQIGRKERLDRITGRISAENITMKTVSEEVGFDLRFDQIDGEWKAEIKL